MRSNGPFIVFLRLQGYPHRAIISTSLLVLVTQNPAQAFTDFGVESLVELVKIHRESTPTRER